MSKPAFKMPDREKHVDDWVAGAGEEGQPPQPQPEAKPKVKMARLTIDLEVPLHAKFKAICALDGTDMVTEVRHFIAQRTQKHENL
jgi:hypothetical protein